MTREQYIRSNKVAYPLIMLACTIVIVTLFGALGQGSVTGNVLGQIIGIVLAMIMSTVFFSQNEEKKSA